MARTLSLITAIWISLSAFPVLSAEQIRLSLGGKMEQYFFLVDTDEIAGESLNATGALTDVDVYFSGKTILDNGIEISAQIELRAENQNSGEADEQFLDIKTAFGKVRIGEVEGFNHNFSYETPFVAFEDDEIVGRVVPQRTSINVKDIMTFEGFTGDAFQVGYESPTIAGFTIGANYFPTTREGVDRFIDKGIGANNAWEVTGAYERRIRSGKVGVVAGYFDSESRTGGTDGVTAWNVSAQAEVGGFTVGGTFARSTPENDLDSTTVGLAGLYEIGPWGLGASYLRVRAESVPNAILKDKVDQGKLEASYILVRGVKLGLTGFWVGQDPAGGPEFDDMGLISSAILRF